MSKKCVLLSCQGRFSVFSFVLAIFGFLGSLNGCGGSGSSPALSVTIAATGATGTSAGLDQGQTLAFTVSVANDSTNSGVTWTSSGVGTLSNSTTSTVTYNAPATVSSASTATVTATSVKDTIKTSSFTIAVSPLPIISTTSVSAGTQGVAYSITLQAAGGAGTLTWSTSSGSLPVGLSLSTGGVLSGTPTAIGSFTFIVKVTDASVTPLSATQQVTLMISPAPVAITTTSLPSAIGGVTYSATFQAAGGVSPLTWSIVSGSLPQGLILSPAGSITGTPAGSGTSTFTVMASDSSSPALTATKQLSITIVQALAVTTTSLPSGQALTTYTSTTLQASGGTSPYTWTVSSGTLPAGLTLSASGVLSGTPTATGTSTFTIKVTDSGSGSLQQSATQSLSVLVNPAQLSITTTSLANATVGTSYSQTLQSSGGTGPITWTISSGSLPGGMNLSGAGVISGTPNGSGMFSFMVKAADSGSPQQTSTKQLAILVNAASPLTILTTALPNGTVGASYSGVIGANGGVTPYAASIIAGALPGGLTISICNNSCNGAYQITGTPNAPGSFTFTLTITDSESPAQSVSQAYTIVINAASPLSINSTTLSGGTVNITYSGNISVTGGQSPYTWAVTTGSLPPGLTLNSTTGALSGTPTTTGSYIFTVKVMDSESTTQSVSQQYNVAILPAGPNNGELKGTYAFYFGGFGNGNTSGQVYEHEAVGSFTADGNGNITSGVMDINTPAGASLQLVLSGVYSIGSDNRGTIVANAGGADITLAVAVGGISGGVAQKVRFIEFDDSDPASTATAVGNGIAKLQSSTAFALSTIKGSFAFGLQGETPCNTCGNGGSTISPYGPVVSVGVFTADGNGNITGGEEDGAAFGNNTPTNITLSGSVTAPSATTGRGTLVLTPGGSTYPVPPTNYVYYIVSSTEIFLMSTDSHASYTLLGGDVLQQQLSNFSNSSLTGNMIAYQTQAKGGDGVSQYPNLSSAGLLYLTASSGQISIFQDQNNQGTITSASIGTATYSVASNGRMTLSLGSGSSSPVFYLINTSQALAVEPTGGDGPPGFIVVTPQTGTSFSNTTFSGSYIFGNVQPPISSNADSGVVTINNGSGNLTQDSSNPNGTLSSGNLQSFTYTTNATTSRTAVSSSGDQNVLYIISPTQAVLLDISPTNTVPTVTVVEQ